MLKEATKYFQDQVFDYVMEKKDLMPFLLQNYLDKHHAVNNTAKALTEKGLSFIAAPKLHHRS